MTEKAAAGGIFDELDSSFDVETGPSPYTGIMGADIIAQYNPDELLMIMKGIATQVKKIRHPDSIENSEPELAERARDPKNQDDDVIAFRKKLQDGAGVIDDLVGRIAQAEADTVGARVQALADIRNEKGYVPVAPKSGRNVAAAKDETSRSKPSTKAHDLVGRVSRAVRMTPEELAEESAEDMISNIRMRQEYLTARESLLDISEAYVLCADGDTGVLLTMGDGFEHTLAMKARQVQKIRPNASVTQSWQQGISHIDLGNDEYERLLDPEDRKPMRDEGEIIDSVITADGGLRLSFNIPGDKASFGRTEVSTFFNTINTSGDGVKNRADFYQLAILDENGRYIAYKTPLAKAARPNRLGGEEATVGLTEWATMVYGRTPAVLCLVEDNEHDYKNSKDSRILYAYDVVSDVAERTLLSRDDFSLRNDSAYRIKMYGYLNNPDQYRISGLDDSNRLELEQKDDPYRGVYTELKENFDVEIRAGTVEGFSAWLPLHTKTASKTGLSLVVASEQPRPYKNDFGREIYQPVDDIRLFAFPNPRAIGVLSIRDFDTDDTQEFVGVAAARKIAEEARDLIIRQAREAIDRQFPPSTVKRLSPEQIEEIVQKALD